MSTKNELENFRPQDRVMLDEGFFTYTARVLEKDEEIYTLKTSAGCLWKGTQYRLDLISRKQRKCQPKKNQ